MKKKQLPKFRSEDQERDFWAKADSTDYIDWTQADRTRLTSLKPTLRTISLRLPVTMIAELKVLANKRDVPYQSLLKILLAERLDQERRSSDARLSGAGELPAPDVCKGFGQWLGSAGFDIFQTAPDALDSLAVIFLFPFLQSRFS